MVRSTGVVSGLVLPSGFFPPPSGFFAPFLDVSRAADESPDGPVFRGPGVSAVGASENTSDDVFATCHASRSESGIEIVKLAGVRGVIVSFPIGLLFQPSQTAFVPMSTFRQRCGTTPSFQTDKLSPDSTT